MDLIERWLRFSYINYIGIEKEVDEKNSKIFGNKLRIVDTETLLTRNDCLCHLEYQPRFERYVRDSIQSFLINYHNVEFINILSRRLNGFNWFDIYVDGFKPSEEEKELTNYYDMYELALRFDPSNIRDEFKIFDNKKSKYFVELKKISVLESCKFKFKDEDLVDLKKKDYYPIWVQPILKYKHIDTLKVIAIEPIIDLILKVYEK